MTLPDDVIEQFNYLLKFQLVFDYIKEKEKAKTERMVNYEQILKNIRPLFEELIPDERIKKALYDDF